MSESHIKPNGVGFSDLETVAALAAHFGKSAAWAEATLKDAGVPVFGGLFSRSAFLAKFGGTSEPSEPSSTVPVLRRTLNVLGLEMAQARNDRGLVGLLVPSGRAPAVVLYTAIDIDTLRALEEEDHGHERHFDDEHIHISHECPRTFRALVARRAHRGVAHFTLAKSKTLARGDQAPPDFFLFLQVDEERLWIMSRDDVLATGVKGGELRHVRFDAKTHSYRFAFPREGQALARNRLAKGEG